MSSSANGNTAFEYMICETFLRACSQLVITLPTDSLTLIDFISTFLDAAELDEDWFLSIVDAQTYWHLPLAERGPGETECQRFWYGMLTSNEAKTNEKLREDFIDSCGELVCQFSQFGKMREAQSLAKFCRAQCDDVEAADLVRSDRVGQNPHVLYIGTAGISRWVKGCSRPGQMK